MRLDSSKTPKYRVAMAAQLTGLSAHVIRIWERRYEAVAPERTASGGRLFSEADLGRLRLLSQLVETGHAISTIAGLSTSQLARLRAETERAEASSGPDALDVVRSEFIRAIEQFDVAKARSLVSRASMVLDRKELLVDVVAPILRVVGERWASDAWDISQEHAATAALRGVLDALPPPAASMSRGAAIAATPAGELHDLGAMMAGMFCGMAGYKTTFLGADLPAQSIATAVERNQAGLLLLSFVSLPPAAARKELTAIMRHVQGMDVAVIIGGATAPRRPLKGVQFLEKLEDLLAFLA
jgi:methanogenic corrinoid protein MtbC1